MEKSNNNKRFKPKRKRGFGNKDKEESVLNSVSKAHDTRQVSIMVRELGGFPDRIRTFIATSSSGDPLGANTTTSKGISKQLNSPYVTTLGWPALSSVYDAYLIHGCRIEVQFVNTSTTIPCRVNIAPYDTDKITAFPLATDDVMVVQPHAIKGNLSVAGGGSDVKSLWRSLDVATLSGTKVNTTVEGLTGYTGSVNSTHAYSNPQVLFAWYVSAQTITGAPLGTNQVYIAVRIIHDIEFYERLPLY